MSLSLYIHIPFCIKKCSYCDFISYSHDTAAVDKYLQGLKQEMKLVSRNLSGARKTLKTIFLGGGTPTSLTATQLYNILEKTRVYFTWESGIEATAEANPGTVDPEKLTVLRAAGVNRLSLGVQAFQQPLLKTIGRIHTTAEIYSAVEWARQAGFANLNLDLMYALPGQTMEDWIDTLDKALALGVEHISAYSLKLESGTPFYQAWQEGKLTPCDQDLEADMYREAIERLTAAGFNHYEISNFARPGRECRHNLTYWLLEEYLGLGPAAHSLTDGRRLANLSNLEAYIAALDNGQRPVDDDQVLTEEDAMAEFMFLGLRLTRGVEKTRFQHRFGTDPTQVYAMTISKLTELNLLEETPELIRLTTKGLALGNEVFEAFI